MHARIAEYPASAEPSLLGIDVAAGDFDGDGDQDLATGASNSTVYVVKGGFTKSGTTGGFTKFTTPKKITYGPDALKSGDVNKDGKDDLIVAGRVAEATDADPGATRSTGWYYPGATAGPGTAVPTTLPGGTSATVGDIDGDGYGEIVLGNVFAKDDDLSGSLGGTVTVVRGSATGPDASTAPTVLTQDSPGVPGTDEERDGFGSALSVGDINADGYGDLAVGVVFEDITTEDTGSTVLLYGSATGLSQTGGRTSRRPPPASPERPRRWTTSAPTSCSRT